MSEDFDKEHPEGVVV